MGAVVDVEFSDGSLPQIMNALVLNKTDGTKLVLEVFCFIWAKWAGNIVKDSMPIKIMKKLISKNVQIKFLKSSDHSLSSSTDLINIKNSLYLSHIAEPKPPEAPVIRTLSDDFIFIQKTLNH